MGKAKTVKIMIANVSVRGDDVVVRVTNGTDEADIRFRYSFGSGGPDVDDGKARAAKERSHGFHPRCFNRQRFERRFRLSLLASKARRCPAWR